MDDPTEADPLDDELYELYGELAGDFELAEQEYHTALPPKLEAWRRRSAAGAILTGFALGLQQALEKEREEPGIVVQTSGAPPSDLPVEADFEYRRPRQGVVNIRPWLIEPTDPPPDPDRQPGPDRQP